MQILPRSTIGTPEPPATRRRLSGVGVLLAHHVGVLNTTRYRSADPARVLDDARAAARWGITSNRPWEYGHMIGLDGSIFEQGGEFMQAHCLDFNHASDSVLFLNADDVQVNDAQIAAWWWLRSNRVQAGVLTADHVAAPHYRYRTTGCPGIRAEAPGKAWQSPTGQGRLGNLIAPLHIEPQPPKPRKRVAMFRIRFRDASYGPGAYTGLICNGTQLGWIGNGHGDIALGKGGAEIVEDMTGAELDGLIATCQTTTDPPPEFSTSRKAAWNARRG